MPTVRRLAVAGLVAATVALLGVSFPGSASAAPAAPVTQASQPSAGNDKHDAVQPLWGAPGGCNPGAFCAYTESNGGGTYCYWYGDAYDMYPCANQEGSVYNNGTACSGCDRVWMYWGYLFAGAKAALGRGDYYLDLHKNTFNYCGIPARDGTYGACAGLGQALWHNIASFEWY